MGIVSFSLSTRMKLLCVVALVAGVRAEAEADPQLLYSGIYPGVYSHAIHAPVVKSVEVKPAPLTYTLPYAGAFPYTYGAYPLHYPYGLVPAMKPAETKVIKAPTYTYSYNHAYHPYTYGYAGYPY